MKIAVFSAQPHDRQFLDAANAAEGHQLHQLHGLQQRRPGGRGAPGPLGFGCKVIGQDPLPSAAIDALKSGQLGGLALDVYEQEAGVFFRDLSGTVVTDDVLQRLVSFPNVIVTGHQAFFTREAIGTISATTLRSASEFARGAALSNQINVTQPGAQLSATAGPPRWPPSPARG